MSHNLAHKSSLNSTAKNVSSVEVSSVKKIKCIVGLPNPRNKGSPKMDYKHKETSSEGKIGRKKKKLVELGPLVPITRFFKKEEQVEHENYSGKSNSNLKTKENLEVGNSD